VIENMPVCFLLDFQYKALLAVWSEAGHHNFIDPISCGFHIMPFYTAADLANSFTDVK